MDPSPDKEQPDRKPPSRGTSKENPEDRKFWGADDEVSDEAAAEEPASEDESPASEEEDPLDHEPDEPEDEFAAPPAPDRPGAPPPSTARRISRRDAVWMALLAVVLLGAVVWALSEFLSNVQTVERPDKVDFPVRGDNVVIGDVNTWWRRPEPGSDRVQLGIHLIPCASIVLKSGSGTVRLRCFFENEAGDYVGDPITLAVADGLFAHSGTEEIVINATGGLKGEGEYNAYAATTTDFWFLRILEGPPSDAAGEGFKEIVRVPISPKRR